MIINLYFDMEKKFITIKEASQMLGVSALTLRNWDKNGKFKATRHPMNNYRVYRLEDVNKLTEEIGSHTENKVVHVAKKQTRNEPVRLQIKHLDS